MEQIVRRIKGRLDRIHEYLLFKLTAKKRNSVFFYPHPNCKNDHYDIINYHSDNVLCLFNYMISHHEYDHLTYYVVIYDTNKLESYNNHVGDINGSAKVIFIDEMNKAQMAKYASKASKIFTDTGHTFFRYKTSGQTLVCLNYFVPFKNDYVTNKEQREERFKLNNIFDAFLMTAPLPARVSACDKGIPLSNFLLLGFCRNDVFYQTSNNAVLQYLSESLNKKIKKFIVFTPTYRDYEAAEKSVVRDIFGYDGSEYNELEEILEDNQAVLIAKLHPKQNNIKSKEQGSSRVVLYSELQNNPFSLYQILAEAEGLITDYTSTYFDFLHRDKPVIFNFYDFDLYTETRGFGFEPIETFCAGEVVKNPASLIEAISSILQGEDKHSNERHRLAPIFDSYYDGNNTKRVCEYFFNS